VVVRCVNFSLPPVYSREHMDVGVEGVVVEISIQADRRWLRIHTERLGSSLPGLWPAEMFEVLDGRIPPNWKVSSSEAGTLDEIYVGPASWAIRGFWDRLDNHDTEDPGGRLYADYLRELDVIMEHARTPPNGGTRTLG
jgi:hypothetical protein